MNQPTDFMTFLNPLMNILFSPIINGISSIMEQTNKNISGLVINKKVCVLQTGIVTGSSDSLGSKLTSFDMSKPYKIYNIRIVTTSANNKPPQYLQYGELKYKVYKVLSDDVNNFDYYETGSISDTSNTPEDDLFLNKLKMGKTSNNEEPSVDNIEIHYVEVSPVTVPASKNVRQYLINNNIPL